MAKSKPKTPMPVSERAKQFAPFSPLRGLEKALSEKEKIRCDRRELTDEGAEMLNKKLLMLERGMIVTAYYYNSREREYLQMTGMLAGIDTTERYIQIVTTKISFDDIFDVNAEE